ncbi:MAG TPA: type II toxin-antitoxin system prevent-host-death family antitoxin [Burkholderiaceae bacterium]|nr:type II toxin-antitoxin system prevent-host-death family antitoxin [Burkholderiaceae bacterium]
MRIGIFEAKNRLSELIDRVESGEEVTITRRGVVVARLVPPRDADGQRKAREAIERLRDARRGVRLQGLSLRDLIDAGRR